MNVSELVGSGIAGDHEKVFIFKFNFVIQYDVFAGRSKSKPEFAQFEKQTLAVPKSDSKLNYKSSL